MWMNHQLKKDYVILASNMEQVQMQSVMCHALLMHYVETHWAPIGHLLAQIGELGSCGLTPPTGRCKCHIVNESDVTQGETGSNSSAVAHGGSYSGYLYRTSGIVGPCARLLETEIRDKMR